MVWHVDLPTESYESAVESFSWNLPGDYNIARDLLRKHEDPTAPALYHYQSDEVHETYSFEALDRDSDRLANYFESIGIERGDRIAVAATQQPATPIVHLACWKLGAVSVALSVLFGEDAMRYRLDDSGARVAVVDAQAADLVAEVARDCTALESVVQVGGGPSDRRRFRDCLADASPEYDIADTDGETPALVLYTSGSTGPPKGVLHMHSMWAGSCPSFLMHQNLDVGDDTVFWTPGDWAWIGALGNAVFPPWHYGRPIVSARMQGFDAELAFDVLETFDVTNAFIPPTALRLMAEVPNPSDRYDLDLRVIGSGSEAVTPEILEWVQEELPGVAVNELYGQTEANVFVADCRTWFEKKRGRLGKPVPGHEVAIVNEETGEPKPPGEIGQIAIRYDGDSMVYEAYWNNLDATANARVNGWHLTGDLGVRDEDGYISFKSRDDELIIASGYRVGPSEVESVLLDHPTVTEVGVVGVPDEERGERIKAFVRSANGVKERQAVKTELREWVRERHAAYAYPREIEFVEDLPKTTTGKVKRRELRERETNRSD
jgi:acetyl-CoA synthetase